MRIKYADVPRCLRDNYFWDWNGPIVTTYSATPWALVRELEGKDVFKDRLDDESRQFLADITGGEFEYAGDTLDC